MGEKAPPSLNPARLLNEGFSALSPQTMLAAPMAASLILLAAVLLVVEAARVVYRATQDSALSTSEPGALTSTVTPPNSADAA